MVEHLAAWQLAEFILGGLAEDELEDVYRHLDECGECVGWLAGVIRVAAYEGAERQESMNRSLRAKRPGPDTRTDEMQSSQSLPQGPDTSSRSRMSPLTVSVSPSYSSCS